MFHLCCGRLSVIQAAAREEILANGGSISHHHGGWNFYAKLMNELMIMTKHIVKVICRLLFSELNTVTKL